MARFDLTNTESVLTGKPGHFIQKTYRHISGMPVLTRRFVTTNVVHVIVPIVPENNADRVHFDPQAPFTAAPLDLRDVRQLANYTAPTELFQRVNSADNMHPARVPGYGKTFGGTTYIYVPKK